MNRIGLNVLAMGVSKLLAQVPKHPFGEYSNEFVRHPLARQRQRNKLIPGGLEPLNCLTLLPIYLLQ